MEIKRIIVECKCGRKLAEWHDKPYQGGENKLILVPPCECAAQHSVQSDGANVPPHNNVEKVTPTRIHDCETCDCETCTAARAVQAEKDNANK